MEEKNQAPVPRACKVAAESLIAHLSGVLCIFDFCASVRARLSNSNLEHELGSEAIKFSRGLLESIF